MSHSRQVRDLVDSPTFRVLGLQAGAGSLQSGGGRSSAPRDAQLTLGWYPTVVSGVLNLGDRTKNAGGSATEQPANFMVMLSHTDW